MTQVGILKRYEPLHEAMVTRSESPSITQGSRATATCLKQVSRPTASLRFLTVMSAP